MRTVVTVGFGGFLARGGGVLDQYALEAAGTDQREAKTRVSGLAGLEHGIMAIGGTAAAIAVLAQGSGQPLLDFSIPWAVIPVPGFLIAFWLAERHRDRFRGRKGWRGSLPAVREMGEERLPEAGGKAEPPDEPSLRRSA